jgi:hypothetical protein
MVSVVSDIRKSTFFKVKEDTGEAEMHFPFANVHLTMDKTLTTGHLYKVAVDDHHFEEYHMAADEASWDYSGGPTCGCDCPNCNACTHKRELLPTNYYCIPVEDTLYRRVVDEICASRSMPFGLFFCGHHEDVDRPSIVIAVAILFLLFASMGVIAYIMKA